MIFARGKKKRSRTMRSTAPSKESGFVKCEELLLVENQRRVLCSARTFAVTIHGQDFAIA